MRGGGDSKHAHKALPHVYRNIHIHIKPYICVYKYTHAQKHRTHHFLMCIKEIFFVFKYIRGFKNHQELQSSVEEHLPCTSETLSSVHQHRRNK